jgi:glycosyltransferase involved in cell wall biosynthesis
VVFKLKIYILYQTTNNATGGGNQFLKAIRRYFIKIDAYTENIGESDVILYNSHQFIPELVIAKQQFPNKLFIHRIDGPIRLYNTIDDRRDFVINSANKYIADGTIFQSNWSKFRNLEMGIERNIFEATILNAPNQNIFNNNGRIKFNQDRKIKLIATSWSNNSKKGFDIYKWLDKNLNFDKYEMTFVGNSPVTFKNINHKKPMNSEDLSNELKQNDIFITASQKDPCSNSLIEALHCGLPAIGLNDGGHTEIISSGGEVFNLKEEISLLLDKVVNNYKEYQKNIRLLGINDVGELYYNFLKNIYNEQKNGNYESKRVNGFYFFKIKTTLFLCKFNEKWSGLRMKLKKI